LFQLRAMKLPEPVREFAFGMSLKRRWRADLAFLEARPPLLVECDGGTFQVGRHTTGAGFEADAEKGAAAMLLGYRQLRVTASQVQDGYAASWIYAALREGALDGLFPVPALRAARKRTARQAERRSPTALQATAYHGTGQPAGHKYPKTRKKLPAAVEAAAERARKP